MTIYINSKQQEMPEQTTIQEALALLNITPSGIALAVNNDIISKHSWEQHTLQPQDKLTIIRATQGG